VTGEGWNGRLEAELLRLGQQPARARALAAETAAQAGAPGDRLFGPAHLYARMLAIGIAWAISTLTLFVVIGARRVDPRLRLTGAPSAALVGGRLAAMTVGGLALAAAYWLLVVVDQDVGRPWAVGPLMLLTAVVAAPFGALVGAPAVLVGARARDLRDRPGGHRPPGSRAAARAGHLAGLLAWRLRLASYEEPAG
jgi:hypothetical protein